MAMRGPGLLVIVAAGACQPRSALDAPSGGSAPWFREGTSCMVCHDRITTYAGEDVSFGSLWQASIMANSARDPYWQAAVRREVLDHPRAQAEIEDECSRCHMPMASELSHHAGAKQRVFANLPGEPDANPLAVDGVACSLCHQISAVHFGEPASFTGGFVIEPRQWPTMFGPYDITPPHQDVMRSALGVVPTRGDHIQRSEMCATCHTLYTEARDEADRVIGRFPEQVPYLEWLHSDYAATNSCQSCHMPTVDQPTPITSVLGTPRPQLSRHDFRGANFLVLAMLNRHRDDLGVAAPALAMQVAITITRSFLEQETARVTVASATREGGTLTADVDVENLAGHKLPTAYPSRRAWLHVTVHDAAGELRFESGKLQPDGSIVGNDNDRDGRTFERHHTEIRSPEDVQIYEPILGDSARRVTTGLTTALVYLKDNRLLPRGFDKRTAGADIAVYGTATDDADFTAGRDRVRYTIDVGDAPGPLAIEAELWFQPIGYRWAHNLRPYRAAEPQRFLRYYEQMAAASAILLANARATAR
jgi:hypothetical protein